MHSCCLTGALERLSVYKMASQQLSLRFMGLMLMLLALSDASNDSSLHKIFRKRDVAGASTAPSKFSVAVPSSKAQEFLAKLSRTKRNIWDRSRPDVQQWIQQFMYMGFDEQRLEADLSYWMDQARSSDQGRQHHYDENAPIGPRDPSAYRHGANVNYDYY
ncbi:augurin-A isoform X1 [Amphiprion ocellaris]|nr:augurin-A isoform X1 [Amphiprion ocellaris]